MKLLGEPAPGFKTYLWLAKERYRIKLRRDRGLEPPWTEDPILQKYHFCNVFRKDDKTSVAIMERCRRAESYSDQLMESVVGRYINRPDSLEMLPEDWLYWNKRQFREWLDTIKLNINAYKIHTPIGINNRNGITDLIFRELERSEDTTRSLLKASGFRAAWNILQDRIYPFAGYQIALDLLETDFWPDSFQGYDWTHVGTGAWRGILLMVSQPDDYESWYKKHDSGCPTNLKPDMYKAIETIRDEMQERWPSKWPTFTIHETQFMLCEYDKYVRKSSGRTTGRIFRGGMK